MPIPNLTDYNDKKEKGLIQIEKIDDDNMAIATKQFSAEDGTELPKTVLGVTTIEVDEAIAAKQKEIDELKAFKSDLQAASK